MKEKERAEEEEGHLPTDKQQRQPAIPVVKHCRLSITTGTAGGCRNPLYDMAHKGIN
jgi:hypothetical protein